MKTDSPKTERAHVTTCRVFDFHFRSRGLSICALLFASLILPCQTSQACPYQEDQIEEPEAQVVMGFAIQRDGGFGEGHTKKFLRAVKKLDVILQLEMQIQQLKRISQLDEAQARKLRVAAKGISQRHTEKWSKEMDQFQMWEDLGATTDDEDENEDVDIKSIDLAKVDPNILEWITIDFTGESGDTRPSQDPRWTKAVKSVLTKEQSEKLSEFQAKRDKKVQDATIEFFAQTYGSELLLSDEQLVEFKKVIRVALVDHPVPSSLDSTYETLMQIASIPDATIAKFMNENQVKRWKILLGPYSGAMGNEFLIEEMEVEADEEMDAQDNTDESTGDDG